MTVENVAFIAGSSKQGRALRASVGSNFVVARRLKTEKKSVLVILVYMCHHMNNAFTMVVSAQQGNNTKF